MDGEIKGLQSWWGVNRRKIKNFANWASKFKLSPSKKERYYGGLFDLMEKMVNLIRNWV